ncbi:V-set and transmembrane domain-containing protein 2-like protein [Triplophysa dalaica]|uniref:V-set and transmembrane domain-containing protein 2-like protein n=1 Tax=Triplophysa dalaica TaxID=1582913 RepID=UPI0024DFA626|nr:V-set and transmembrane domain-containing protein 2-like protein [Triplophysa dalaica]
MLWILHYVGLCAQIIRANMEVDNRVSGNALFTEVPHDIMSRAGEDVELKCSFRGASSSSVSLEIQWWYARHAQDWPENPGWTTNQVLPQEDTLIRETKISVVKVVGSNISHKLRLSSIKSSDEGTYKCRVIDFSESQAQQHSVQAYVQVQPADLLQQVHTQLQNKGPVLLMDQTQYWSNRQLKDGEHKNKSNKYKPGDEDHRMIHHKIAAQMRQEMDHQFRKVGLQHHQKVNKTRAGNKQQSESRELM